MTTIPGLPPHLTVVPSWRDDDAWRAEWHDWAAELIDLRAEVLARADEDAAFRRHETALCAASTSYFLAMYGWIFEPRDTPLGPPGWYPWAPFALQVDLADEVEAALASPRGHGNDLVVEKSRDMGATWTVCGVVAKHWLFDPVFTAGLVSFREDAVDDASPDSMFFKLRGLLGILPDAPGVPRWMFPSARWDHDLHNRKLLLRHPERSSTVKGEALTALAGTGGRATLRLNDEAAKFTKGLNNVLTSQGAVTNHRVNLSSAYVDFGTDFQDLAQIARDSAGRIRYLRLDPWLHPFHDEEWMANERETTYAHDPEGFRREVMIDYVAGFGDRVYPQADAIATPEGLGPLDPAAPRTLTAVGCDVGGTDQTTMVVCQRDADDPAKTVRLVDLYRRSKLPAEWYAHVATGIPPAEGDAMLELWRRESGPEEARFMAFTASLPWDERVSWFGDPTGGARESVTRLSFWDAFEAKALELRRRQRPGVHRPLRVVRSWDKRDLLTRRLATREVLQRTVCADTAGARYALRCLQRYKFQEVSEAGRTGEPKPIHDKRGESDVVTGFEYFAIHDAAGLTERRDRRQPVRLGRDGRKVA